MYKIKTSKTYKTQFKKQSKQNQDLIDEVVGLLCANKPLEPKHKDHQLKGDYKGFKECHIKPDLLLIYRIKKQILELHLINLGSHSDIFG